MAKPWDIFLMAILAVTILAIAAKLEASQILAISLFATLIAGTLLFWRFRLAFAFLALATLLGAGLLDVPTLIEYASLDIILFLAGMMVVVGYLEEKGLFEFLINRVLELVGNNARLVVTVLMLLAALSAAIVDEVTSILFMMAAVLSLTGRFGVNPVPYVMMVVFATNIGSSATVVGNPVGILIALKAGLTFVDFLRWAAPISLAALAITIPLVLQYFSSEVRELQQKMVARQVTMVEVEAPVPEADPDRQTDDRLRADLGRPLAVLIATLAGLVFHSTIEGLLGLAKNTMLLGTAMLAAGAILLLERERAREIFERRVDWWTLTFFLILFASVGTLRFVGVTRILAEATATLSQGNYALLFFLLVWVVGTLSALMDNVLAVATFVPIIHDLGALGIWTFPLWWGMLFAGTFLGNLTTIGSTANIVALGMMEQRKAGHITIGQWIKAGLRVSVLTLALASLLLYVQFPLMPT